MNKKRRLTISLVSLFLCACLAMPVFAADGNQLASMETNAVSFVPQEASRYTITFSADEALDLSTGASIQVTFPQGFSLVKGEELGEDPGCSLAGIQYKNNPKDKYYSVLHGDVSINSNCFTLLSSGTDNTLNQNVCAHLTVPGVVNGESGGTLALRVKTADGKVFTAAKKLTLGIAPADAPASLTLSADKSSEIIAKWNCPPAGGERYRLLYSGKKDGQYIQACNSLGRDPNPGEMWELADTSYTFTGQSHLGLEYGKTYYFKVQTGNEFGFGPLSEPAAITTPVLGVVSTSPAKDSTSISPDTSITLKYDQPVKLLDSDRIRLYKKATGTPVDAVITVTNDALYVSAALDYSTEYQLVVYTDALAGVDNPEVYNNLYEWSFTTKMWPHGNMERGGL